MSVSELESVESIPKLFADYQPTKLVVNVDDFEDWKKLGASLGVQTRGVQWWVADWIVYGESRFGDDALHDAEDATGLSPATLVNLRWIGSRVHASRRREELSFSHHAEVAALEPAEQKKALQRAVDERLTVRGLRLALRETPAPTKTETNGDGQTRIAETGGEELQRLRYLEDRAALALVATKEARGEIVKRCQKVSDTPNGSRPRWTIEDVNRVSAVLSALQTVESALEGESGSASVGA